MPETVHDGSGMTAQAQPMKPNGYRHQQRLKDPTAAETVAKSLGDGVSLSTVEIAAATPKRHHHVAADSRAMLLELYGEPNLPKFREIYMDGRGRQRTCYRLGKREILVLATG